MSDLRSPEESVSAAGGDLDAARPVSLQDWRTRDPIVAVILGSVCVYVAGLVDRGWIPTPVFYDFFADEEDRTDRILRVLDREDVNVAVLNTALRFLPPPPPRLVEALEARYGSARMVGPFIVRWN